MVVKVKVRMGYKSLQKMLRIYDCKSQAKKWLARLNLNHRIFYKS